VSTPQGLGTVNYQRMAPPSYSQAEAVSVLLDERRVRGFARGELIDPDYEGTIFPAATISTIFPAATISPVDDPTEGMKP
jgi:hypothetical protein